MKRTGAVRPALVSRWPRLLAAGCQSERPGGAMQIEVAAAAVPVLQQVNERAHQCWIRSGDRAFRGLAVIPELDTRTGNPRILIVERLKAQGLPRFRHRGIGHADAHRHLRTAGRPGAVVAHQHRRDALGGGRPVLRREG
ncbi:MAG: hypothetical protein H6891_02280 [Brucellaceae bacterium]|nr:hypothetical protein [Brucellaceae bacterium]